MKNSTIRLVVTVITAAWSVLFANYPAVAGPKDLLDRLTGKTATLRIVVNDISASVPGHDPRELFMRSSKQFLSAAEAGDTLAVTTIGEQMTERVRVEKFNIGKTGRAFDDKKLRIDRTAEALKAAEKSVEHLRAPRSRYLETLRAFQQDIATARASGMTVLVRINGDALEDGVANFENDKLDDAAAAELIARLKKEGTLIAVPPAGGKALPPLQLSFVGVGGGSAAKYERVERFWRKYAEACGAIITHYGVTIPG